LTRDECLCFFAAALRALNPVPWHPADSLFCLLVNFSRIQNMKVFSMTHINKYVLLHSVALCAALGAVPPGMAQPVQQRSEPVSSGSGQALPVVEVYKSAECGCCKIWAEHLQKSGFKVMLNDVDDVPAARKKLGMPNKYGACHSAKVGKYLVEGHVPAADIKRLLKESPNALGLAVPSMPPGSPGMESDNPVPYDTLLVGKDGSAKVFARH
jgi:hypothetical protein